MLVLGSAAQDGGNYTDTVIGDPNDNLVFEEKTEWVKEGSVQGETVVTEGEVDPNYQPVLPFSEEQERKRGEMQLKYAGDNIGLAIDSIEPEAGPITGETRVLVHGGPFEDMSLIYPKPKCKFGANDRIVDATYVKCHTRPLSMEDKEGKSKDKVSILVEKIAFLVYSRQIFVDRHPGASNVTIVPQLQSLRSYP